MVKFVDVYPDGYEAILLDSPAPRALPVRARAGRRRDDDARTTGNCS